MAFILYGMSRATTIFHFSEEGEGVGVEQRIVLDGESPPRCTNDQYTDVANDDVRVFCLISQWYDGQVHV